MPDTSILNTTKKILGIDESYTAFDQDIIFHINSVFSVLNQLGVGPDEGFMIEDETALWGDFLTDNRMLNSVKNYVYLRVRLLFDPPTTSYLLSALQDQIKEIEWRISVRRENEMYPTFEVGGEVIVPRQSDQIVLDGGGA